MTTPPDSLADDLLDAIFDANPVAATMLGIRNREHRLPDLSEAGDERFRDRLDDITARAEAVDAASGLGEEAVTLAVVRAQAQAERDHLGSRAVEYTVTDSLYSPVVAQLMFLPLTTINEPAHAEGYLTRLASLPTVLDAVADRHRAGIACGRLPVRRLANAAVAHIDRVLADPGNDALRRPRPSPTAEIDVTRFAAERDRLLADVVRPALARYRDMLATEVVPQGRPDDRAGVCWLPGGVDSYLRLVRAHTTTDRTPEELHEVGRDLLAQLREEYADLGSRVFGTGDVNEIVDRLRSDPALRWRDGEELLAASRAATERAARAAAAWFGAVPSEPCVVAAVPAAEAPGAARAYYAPPAMDGSRPGTFFVNTHQAWERHRHTCEVTTFHEALPGHHLQIALAQRLTDLPLLRRLIPFQAYAEGWGLYAERLADEMGLYTDGIARLGMLSADATRAARLVADTGLHAMGWHRSQAVSFLRAHTALSEVEVESEADRYIAAPGQALAYMVGRLEIQRLRAEAERALGNRFDLAGFHDTVLGSGALPLTVLEEIVRAWVTGRRAAPPAG